jgi:hypothetical protein
MEVAVDARRENKYEILEGTVSHLITTHGVLECMIGERHVTVIGSRVIARLREGDYVRALAREPLETAFYSVLALQWRGDAGVRYTGRPRASAYIAFIAATLIAAGLYTKAWWLLAAATPLVVLRLLLDTHEAHVVRRFEAYCRTSAMGSLRS